MIETQCTGEAVDVTDHGRSDIPHGVSRRTVLSASAAVVAGLTLAACSSPVESATEPAPQPTGTGDGHSTGGDRAAGERLVGTSDLAVGGGAVLMASVGPVVVTHPADGEFKAFNGRCPHAGCPVASVAGNTITCNCHGSTFDAVTGDRTGGPAPKGLTPLEITVEGDAVYLT
jgi:nitrite reductase/ring-hydroxylating ferredoxin subunit